MQGIRQELRMRQEQHLQPQQILRSELIQLPLLELELRVRAELEENPFLDEMDESDASEDAGDNAEINSPPIEDEEPLSPEPDAGDALTSREVDWEDILNDADHWQYRAQHRQSFDEGFDIPQPDVVSLTDHLLEQLSFYPLTPDQVAIGEEIIGNINRDGYLEVGLSEIAETLGKPIEEVERMHQRILTLDPIGIGSRNLRECLNVQLVHHDQPAALASRIIEEFWEDFINKRYENLAENLEVDLDSVKDAYHTISRLNPKPGEGYFDEKQNYIVPDLIVSRVGDEFVVYLNDGDVPNFHINAAYREMYLHRRGREKQVREFLTKKLESARWFINAIHQRRTTMVRTMRAIVEKQEGFFRNGPSKLKPMKLADIAGMIEMDISTVSRVTNSKYVQTEWGIFELKYFFSESMETEEDGEVSNRVIKARLKDLIDGEDKISPLSDLDLTELLNEEGFHIRRRTVAKYREQMRIPVKRLRREI